MKLRTAVLVLSLVAVPVAVVAQGPGKVYRIGVLDTAAEAPNPNLDAFREGLRELGYVEGENLVLEYRFPEDARTRSPVWLPSWCA